MTGWTSATKQDVLDAVGSVVEHAGPAVWAEYHPYMVEPYPVALDRSGSRETVFVVANVPPFVVFYEDVEEEFALAKELDGSLIDWDGSHADLRVCIRAALGDGRAVMLGAAEPCAK